MISDLIFSLRKLFLFPLIFVALLSPRDGSAGDWDVSADFLVWHASEETAAVWTSVLSTELKSGGLFSTFNATDLSFDWDLGFRVGAGYNFDYDQWDTQLNWTWFRTEKSAKVPVNDHVILPEFFAGFIHGDIGDSTSVDWSILFNMFDWDLGRSYWISKGLQIRPFIGLKGGWIYQSIQSKLHVVSIDSGGVIRIVDFNAHENLKNNFWGIGPTGGINTKWKLGSSPSRFFTLFGDFAAATLWGTWIYKDVYKDDELTEIAIKMKNSHLGALMLKGFMGIGWETAVNRGLSHFAIRLGYEMQIWFNQLRIPTFQQLLLHGDLTLQGGTLNCRLDF